MCRELLRSRHQSRETRSNKFVWTLRVTDRSQAGSGLQIPTLPRTMMIRSHALWRLHNCTRPFAPSRTTQSFSTLAARVAPEMRRSAKPRFGHPKSRDGRTEFAVVTTQVRTWCARSMLSLEGLQRVEAQKSAAPANSLDVRSRRSWSPLVLSPPSQYRNPPLPGNTVSCTRRLERPARVTSSDYGNQPRTPCSLSPLRNLPRRGFTKERPSQQS